MSDPMDRRAFLKVTGQTALLAALAKAGGPFSLVFAQDAGGGEKVSMVFFDNFAPAAVNKAALKAKFEEALTPIDMSWLKQGDSVAINVASNSAKPYPMTTNPDALEVFVKILKERGAGRVVVADLAGMENVAPPFVNERVARKVRELWGDLQTGVSSGMEVLEQNGIAAAARRGGAEVASFDSESDWIHVKDAGLGWTPDKSPLWPGRPWYRSPAFPLREGGFRVAKLTREVDHLVNFARPSGHVMTGHTGTVKNWYGWLHPLDRVWSHTRIGFRSTGDMRWGGWRFWRTEMKEVKDLHERVAEVAVAFKPKTRLNVNAGVDTYCDVGPDWGTQPLQQSFVMVSGGMVGIDAAMVAVLAHEKRRVPKEERARRYGHPDRDMALPLLDDEVFWGRQEGSMHRHHRTYVIDELIAEPREEGVWDTKQLRHATKIGLGEKGVEYLVGGEPDADYSRAIRHLSGGTSTPIRRGDTRGAGGALQDGVGGEGR